LYPFISFGNGYYIPTYILTISLTYSCLLFWVYWRAEKLQMSTTLVLDYALVIMVGGFLGGRLMHVFYENWSYYQLFPIEIVKVWQGGFVFYGGMIGSLAASAAYARLSKTNLWVWTDFFAPALAIGYAFGRIGCFLNGCCFGELCDLPWAIEFGQPGLPTGPRHPTQLYATLWELLLTLPLVTLLPSKLPHLFKKHGQIFGVYLISHGIGRLLMEGFRDDFRGSEILGLSVSSWLSLLAVAFGACLFLRLSPTRQTSAP
jgi:phosphatidylglycerol---prolipoprotein diacylglyceryl transferase